jgi:hypothetical protein
MRRDFDQEIRQLRQDIHDIDIVIAYFERLEAQLAGKEKQAGAKRLARGSDARGKRKNPTVPG